MTNNIYKNKNKMQDNKIRYKNRQIGNKNKQIKNNISNKINLNKYNKKYLK